MPRWRSPGRRRPPTAAVRSQATGSRRTSARPRRRRSTPGPRPRPARSPVLTNGTAYTFKVAATMPSAPGRTRRRRRRSRRPPPRRRRGRRRASRARPVTPRSRSRGPRPPSNGGSAITSYRITPYIGATAQTAINTGTTGTTRKRHRSHQRHRVHVQGRRDQRGRHRRRLGRVAALTSRLHGARRADG